jgi:hypothetical protein
VSSDVKELGQSLNKRISNLKEEIVKEVCIELQGKVMKAWRDGTDKFYNDAKSIISNYSRSPSVASDIDLRSRSGSFDIPKRSTTDHAKKNGAFTAEKPKNPLKTPLGGSFLNTPNDFDSVSSDSAGTESFRDKTPRAAEQAGAKPI